MSERAWPNVRPVRSRKNDQYYAVKVLAKDKVVRMKQIEHTNNEADLLQSVESPFVINLYGVFQDTSNLYMVMEFVPGGELFTLLRRSSVRCQISSISVACPNTIILALS